MPFPFVYVCDILEALERVFRRQIPILDRDVERQVRKDVTDWFRRHRNRLNVSADSDAVMLTLRPEKQLDRVYGFDSKSLELVIARALCLSRQQYSELQQWKESEVMDLGGCLQRVLQKINNSAGRNQGNDVTVEEIDQSLLLIAACNPSSSAEVRSLARTWKEVDTKPIDKEGILSDLYKRLSIKEAKWLTRLVLKSYAPVKFPDELDLSAEHSFLPNCISVRVQMPSASAIAVRRDGTGIIRGVSSGNHSLPTPPTSLPNSSALRTTITLHKTQPPNALETPSSSSNIAAIPRVPTLNAIQKSPRRSAMSSQEAMTPGRSVLGPLFSNLTQSGHRRSPSKSSQPEGATPLRIAGRGTCQFTSKTCKFTRCLFLLSPCISSTPWLMDDLLPQHGARVLTSLSALAYSSLPRHCPQTGRRYRKIALVESNRTEQTAVFLKKISKLELKRKGKKEWVEVYDWRVLECFTKVEQGKEVDYDPWKRCWIGAV